MRSILLNLFITTIDKVHTKGKSSVYTYPMLLILKTLNINKPQEELEVDEIYENSPDNYLKDFMVFKLIHRSSSHMPKDLHQVLTAIILKLEKIESEELCSKELETTLRSLQKKFFKNVNSQSCGSPNILTGSDGHQ